VGGSVAGPVPPPDPPVLRAVAGEERGLEGCERGRPIRLLDVGSGGGDLAREIQRWGRRDGFRLEVTGIDPDPRALAYARSAIDAEPGPVVTFRQARAADLVAAGERFHVVVSNHVLHHLATAEVPGFLADLEALASHRVVVSDIERSTVGYALFSALAALPPSGIPTSGPTGSCPFVGVSPDGSSRGGCPPGGRLRHRPRSAWWPFGTWAGRAGAWRPGPGDGEP
jgi:SAM-dependent methyltransferase